MTLYVNEPKYDGMGVDAKRPASLRERLTARGWVQCGSCGGNGRVPDRSIPTDYPCPDCVEGLVPPEGMLSVSAKAMHESVDIETRELLDESPWLWENVPESIKQKQMVHARAALIAATRWEREQ